MILNGYRATHKNKWYFVQCGILSVQELALLEFYADIFCFDPKKFNFGTFEVNFEKIKKVFNCKSDTTIRNWHKRLLEAGFIEKTNDKQVFRLVCCGRYIIPSKEFKGEASKYNDIEKNQPIEVILQSFGINFQSNGTKVQNNGNEDIKESNTTGQTKSLTKGSYKDGVCINSNSKLVKVVILRQKVRTPEEYQRIFKENDSQGLSPDDMLLADEVTHEEVVVESEEQEKEIIKEWFGGNRAEYEKSSHMDTVKSIENL